MNAGRTGAPAALAVIAVLAGSMRAYGCGTDRWPPKVFGDADVASIAAKPAAARIADLTALKAPPLLSYTHRIKPVETTVYRLTNVTLSSVQLAPDGDYELYLRDGAGNEMVAESPDPACLHASPLSAQAAAARKAIAQRLHPTLVPTPVNERVTVTGVGFFDYEIADAGHAKNGIELHPVLSIAFEGPAARRTTQSTSAATAPYAYAASTTSAPSTLFYAYKESGAISREMDPTASGTLGGQTLTYQGGASGSNFGWISASGVPGATSWPAQTYTIRLNVTAPNANLHITEVKVYRVDSNGGPSTGGLAVVGDLKTSVSLGTAGTLTFSVPGTAQSASSTDRIAAKFYVSNASSSTQSFAYQAGSGTLSTFTGGSGTTPTPAPTSTPAATPTPVPTSGTSSFEQTILSSNPVQYYPLDDSSGTTVRDESAAHANGVYDGGVALGLPGPLIGQTSAAAGMDAGAYDVGAKLPAPNIPTGSSYSIETWVYPVYGRSYMTLWGSSSSKRLLLGTNGILLAQFSGNFYSKRSLSAYGWHQVVFVYNAASQTQTYYIDGSADASASLPSSAAAFASPYYLGEYDTSGNYKWHGRMADHAVYAFALTSSQIASQYKSAGYPPVSPTPQPTAEPTPDKDSPCAGYRWPVKVATDGNANSIALSPVTKTTIPWLTGIPQPNTDNVLARVAPAEDSAYELVNVTLTEIFKASDYDYHLLLTDAQGHTMIAESPDPSCANGSALYSQLVSARNAISAAYPNVTSSGIQVNRPVTLEGLPFFDYVPNYATDEAPDGIEIHPILAICFGSNCTLSTPGPSPTPSPTASPTPSPAASPTPAPSPTASGTSAYGSAVLADSPHQYYKLNENAGPTAYDSSGSNANGAYVGSVTYGAPGPLLDESSTAIRLAGGTADAGVSLPNPNAAAGTSYTIEAWVYPVLGSNYMAVWGYNASHRLLVASNGLLLTQFGTNFFSKHALSSQQWHYVAFVYDAASQQGSYYIDGALDSSASLSSSAAAFTSSYYLGQYDTSSNYKWNGSISQAAFYPAALSASQVAAHYAAAGYGSSPAPSPSPTPSVSPSPTPTPSASPSATPSATPSPSSSPYESAVLAGTPLEYLELNDAGGPTAVDSSGNHDNGTYTGTVTFGAAGPLRSEASTAITLSGGTASAGVLVPNPSAAAGSSYSIELWVDPAAVSGYMTLWGYDKNHRLLLSGTGQLLSQLDGNFFSSGTLSRNAWHQVVFVYDAAAQTASYYIDGKFDSSASVPQQYGAFTSSYYLGEYDTGTYYKWDGGLAQAAFYRRALSASEIAQHYTAAGY